MQGYLATVTECDTTIAFEPTKLGGGGNSLTVGILSNWAGFAVFLVSGMVMPRLISDRLGQELLGLWDFGWTLVASTGLLGLGMVSATSRFVARDRAMQDAAQLNRAVSACATVLWTSCGLIVVVFMVLVYLTPSLLEGKSDLDTGLARWIVAILGVNAAVQLPLSLYAGIVSGCRRFDLKNLLRCAFHLAGLAVMAAILAAGGGLIAVAVVSLTAEVGTAIATRFVALQLCPSLKIRQFRTDWDAIRDVLGLGGKTALQGFSRIVLYQANGIIIACFLGPAPLAIFSRQRALVMFISRLFSQFGNVFTPVISEAHARQDTETIRCLLVNAARFGFALALPIVIIFAIGGEALVRLWMGPGYEAPAVLAILAFGHLPAMAHRGVFMALAGMNRHGKAAAAEALAALLSVGVGLLLVGVFKWGILGAAVGISVCVLVGGGAGTATVAAHELGMGRLEYWGTISLGPLLAVTPLVFCMLVARFLFAGQPFLQLAAGVGGGGAVLVPIYWRFFVPQRIKRRVRKYLQRRAGGKPEISRPDTSRANPLAVDAPAVAQQHCGSVLQSEEEC